MRSHRTIGSSRSQRELSTSQELLRKVYQTLPAIEKLAHLAQGFFRIIREQDLPRLTPWIIEAKQTALTGFATRLERDFEAAKVALTLPWSQGHVEGQVHRLKLIKRQMYGRARRRTAAFASSSCD